MFFTIIIPTYCLKTNKKEALMLKYKKKDGVKHNGYDRNTCYFNSNFLNNSTIWTTFYSKLPR